MQLTHQALGRRVQCFLVFIISSQSHYPHFLETRLCFTAGYQRDVGLSMYTKWV